MGIGNAVYIFLVHGHVIKNCVVCGARVYGWTYTRVFFLFLLTELDDCSTVVNEYFSDAKKVNGVCLRVYVCTCTRRIT